VVNAVTEGDVAAGVAAEVEAVGAGELGRIPVGRTDHREDPLTRRDVHAADRHVLGGEPVVGVVYRAGEPE
jgi:hypothetical protein